MRVCFAHRTLNAGKICLFVCFRLIQILHGSTTQQKSCCWFQLLFLTHWLWPRSLWPYMWELFIHLRILQRSTAQAEEKFSFFKNEGWWGAFERQFTMNVSRSQWYIFWAKVMFSNQSYCQRLTGFIVFIICLSGHIGLSWLIIWGTDLKTGFQSNKRVCSYTPSLDSSIRVLFILPFLFLSSWQGNVDCPIKPLSILIILIVKRKHSCSFPGRYHSYHLLNHTHDP